MVKPAQFLGQLFGSVPTGYELELRRIPGGGEFYQLDQIPDPTDLSNATYYFSVAPRRVNDRGVDVGNLVWCDNDGKLLSVNQVQPAPTAVVFSGSVTAGVRHLHLYWHLDKYQDVLTCTRLSTLATVAFGGDFAVCESRRVMRVPGSMNQKDDQNTATKLDVMDPSLVYSAEDLEERLVAAIFRPHYTDGQRHELTMNIAGLLTRAGWDLRRALACVNYLYELSPGHDLNGKLTAVRTTYQKREAGEAVVSRYTREVLGDELYGRVLVGLGITSRDGDLLIGGEVVGGKKQVERDIANYVIANGNWASSGGRVVRWNGLNWELMEAETLKSEIFKVLASMREVIKGEEVQYVPKASTAGAIASVVIGQLLERPLPDPDPLELPLANGILNVATGKLGPHRKEAYHQWTVPLEFDSSAQCPVWESFVSQSAPGVGVSYFLQEWAGYCLIAGNDWQRMLWLYGPSGTGKSTFIKVINGLLGPAAVAIGSEKFTEYTLAELAGKRVAMASELSPRTMKTSMLKALIAADPMQARHPYGRPFDMTFRGKLVWSSNAMPPLDQSEGMRRRINVVEFNQVPAQVDVYLEKKLEVELPGILNWALVGVNRLLALRALGSSDWELPPSVRAFVDQYMESTDPTAQFFQEEVELVANYEFPAIEVYQRYVEWAKSRQVYIESWGPAFYRAMSNHGLESAGDKKVGKRTVKMWRGGRLIAGVFGYSDEV